MSEENINIEKQEFKADLTERVIAVLMWPVSFLYASMLFENEGTWNIMFVIFGGFFIILAEIMYFKKKRSIESVAVLIMAVITITSVCLPGEHVFSTGQRAFFSHLFAVYWALCRANMLSNGETSHMMVWDGIMGFFVIPFSNFFINIRTIITLIKTSDNDKRRKALPAVLLASLAAIILFAVAISYLMHADANYSAMMQRVGGFIKTDINEELAAKLAFTVIISMYIYGLIGGCYRAEQNNARIRGDRIKNKLASLQKVPAKVWIVFIAIFSIFYVLFFIMQGRYLINAFIMELPNGFTYSQYARKGFGDMCGVTVVNFILLWLLIRTSESSERGVTIAGIVLNVESMLFSLIGFLKIMMYIDAYGFTPLRLQSVWAAGVLIFACICTSINMLTGRKTAKMWFMGSSGTLAILSII